MRQQVQYKICHAGTFKGLKASMDVAVEFANTLEPQQVISFNIIGDGRVVVWYRER